MHNSFEVVRTQRTLKGECGACGQYMTRSRTFAQTVNPDHPAIPANITMNNPMARTLVRESVELEADAWEPDFTHPECRKD